MLVCCDKGEEEFFGTLKAIEARVCITKNLLPEDTDKHGRDYIF